MPFLVPSAAAGVELDGLSLALSGFDWAVPVLVLSVPGLLIVIAVLAQALIGLAWVPVTRRWLGGDRRRRRPGLTPVSPR